MPPSIKILKERLCSRGSESKESLQVRLSNAEKELSKNKEFDKVILNDDFDIACDAANQAVEKFINS